MKEKNRQMRRISFLQQQGKLLCYFLISITSLLTSCTTSSYRSKLKADTVTQEGVVEASAPQTDKQSIKKKKQQQKKSTNQVAKGNFALIEEQAIPLPRRIPAQVNFSSKSDFKAIYFVYDSSGLTAEGRSIIAKHATSLIKMLKAGKVSMVLLEGHSDARGTNEYNLALGERRSMKVRNYLISLGVPSKLLYVKSWGEEKPAMTGDEEAAWVLNRRVEFKVSLRD